MSMVCSCHAINDRAVCAAVGAGATTVEDVMAVCGAGRTCGGCVPVIETLLVVATVGPEADSAQTAA